ncbi:hypothetical protein CA13_15510 [Planctomycetes bacterium CA13]|uniref:Uncharacterized protein n=1 Tax=Novipirellula herctigrandis TaxID=2527986 RepID=A0A5C5YYG3_9BACT|nr:hypothetical protein CA13_15510 [Planctomycetes bacterium CA13]
MTNTSEPKPEKPLITFALLAYNQEKLICESIEGAFAKTHSPLEFETLSNVYERNTKMPAFNV